MMARLLVLALALAARAAAQVVLVQVPGDGTETPVGSSLEFGSKMVGDSADAGSIKLRLWNRTPQAVNIQQLYASSTPVNTFVTAGYPPLPVVVAPGNNLDFRVRFTPRDPGAFTGFLNIAFLAGAPLRVALNGASPQGLIVQVQNGASFETITTATRVDFGVVERKQSAIRQFALVNNSIQALDATVVFVNGPGYALEGLTAPVMVAPGQTRTFAIRFAPATSGILNGLLSVDGREFALQGFAVEPALPTLSFEPINGLTSGQQATIRLRLSEASKAIGTVKVTLTGLEQDPAVLFLPASSRTASLPIAEGTTELSVVLQTGTTAGTLKLTAELGAQSLSASVVLAAAAPILSTASATRQGGRIELRLAGFDNTRSPREAAFWFYDSAGNLLAGPIRSTVADAFSRFYGTSALGGLFALGASFPVTGGDINTIRSFEAELSNTQGATKTARTAF